MFVGALYAERSRIRYVMSAGLTVLVVIIMRGFIRVPFNNKRERVVVVGAARASRAPAPRGRAPAAPDRLAY